MSDGINPTNLSEAPKRVDEVKEVIETKPEVQETAAALEKATLKPEEKVEAEGDFQISEDLEKEVVAAVEAAPKLETPPAVTLEGAGAEGKVTITEAAEPAAIIDSNDREVMAAEAAADGGPTTEDGGSKTDTGLSSGGPPAGGMGSGSDGPQMGAGDTMSESGEGGVTSEDVEAAVDGGPRTEDRVEVAVDESVMIDTVPLPEKPATTADAGSRESIGTWPTPESPEAIIDSNDGVAIIDTNDGTSKISTGPDLGDVAIIDSNDGASSVGIIDSNDGISAEAIIDSNDMNTIETEEKMVTDAPHAWSDRLDQGGEDDADMHEPDGVEIPEDIKMPPEDSVLGLDDTNQELNGRLPSSGGLEIGSVEEVINEIPETGEPTPTEESNPEETVSENNQEDLHLNILLERLEAIKSTLENDKTKLIEYRENWPDILDPDYIGPYVTSVGYVPAGPDIHWHFLDPLGRLLDTTEPGTYENYQTAWNQVESSLNIINSRIDAINQQLNS